MVTRKGKRIISFICLIAIIFSSVFTNLSPVFATEIDVNEVAEESVENETEQEIGNSIEEPKIENEEENSQTETEQTEETAPVEETTNEVTEEQAQNEEEVVVEDVISNNIIATNDGIMLLADDIDDMDDLFNKGDKIKCGVIDGTLSKYGHELHYIEYDGNKLLAFCIQYGVTSPDGRTYTIKGDVSLKKNDNYKSIAEDIFFGHVAKYEVGLPTTSAGWKSACITQQRVWKRCKALGLHGASAPSISSWKNFDQDDYDKWVEDMKATKTAYNTKVSINGKTKTMYVGESVTVNDTKSVLSKYPAFDKTINGIQFKHSKNSNDLVITAKSAGKATFDSNAQKIYKTLPDGRAYDKVMNDYRVVDFKSADVQDLIWSNYVAPITFTYNAVAVTGEVTLNKQDSETQVKERINNEVYHGEATLDGTEYTLYSNATIKSYDGATTYFNTNDEIAKFTFNSKGVASVNITNNCPLLKVSGSKLVGLPKGKYYVMETKASNGYIQDTNKYTFTLSYDGNNQTYSYSNTFSDTIEKAPFELIKVSTKESEIAPKLEGVEFTAILTKYVDFYGSFDEALKHISEFNEDEYDVMTTNSEGHATSKRLAFGNYTIRETKLPSNQVKKVKDFHININKNSTEPIEELVVNNEPFKAYIKLQKLDKETGKAVTYSSAKFSLYKENGADEWEKVKCKTGKTYYDTWTTDNEGIAYTETPLDCGNYKVDEIKLPENFLKLEEPVFFTIDNTNETIVYDEDNDAYITVTIKNEQPKGKIVVNKSIANNLGMDKSFVTNVDYTKIKFKLTAKAKIIDYIDGSTIYEKGQEIGTYNLLADGTLTIENLPMGKYQLQEIETLDGLVLDETVYNINLAKKDDVTKLYTVTKNIKNYPTIVEISKNKVTGEDEIPGTTLTVTDEEGNVVDSWVSTDREHFIEGLKVGKTYTLREDLAPLGYVKATEQKFTVENVIEAQEVTMVDKVVTISKVDVAGEEIEGATMQVKDDEGNVIDEWVSTKEPHNVSGLEEGKHYTLHEEVAIEGYVKATDIDFTVSNKKVDEHYELTDKVVTISKVDVAGEEIEGATMQVKDDEGNIIDEWVSTKEPHNVSGLEENKHYTLHEEVAIEGYVKATDIDFTVSGEKVNEHYELTDKIVSVSKKDVTTGEELPGATLTVTDEEGNVIDEWVSTDEPHNVSGLEEGKKYFLEETITPYGYKTSEKIEFEVSYEKENQLVEMLDERKVFNLAVDKELTGIVLDDEDVALTDTLEIYRKESDKNSLKLEYTITVTNPSELEGFTTLYDYIPEGYVALEEDNPDWEIDGDKAYIKIENIDVGETLTFKIVLTSNEVNAGKVTNKVDLVDSGNLALFDEETYVDNSDVAELDIDIHTILPKTGF